MKLPKTKNKILNFILYFLAFCILLPFLLFGIFGFLGYKVWQFAHYKKWSKWIVIPILALIGLPSLIVASAFTSVILNPKPVQKAALTQSSSTVSSSSIIPNSSSFDKGSSSISNSLVTPVSSVPVSSKIELPPAIQTVFQTLPTIQPEPVVQKVSEIIQDDKESGLLLDVQKVIDGDTVKVSQIGKLRLIGIDTPELKDPRKPVQCFALEASNKAKELLNGRKVYLAYNPAEKLDKYNRTLAYVFRDDGLDFNAEMIKLGYAQAYTKYPHPRLDEFVKYGKEAREKKLGLWSDSTCAGQVNQQYSENTKKKETIIAPLPVPIVVPTPTPKVVETPKVEPAVTEEKGNVLKTTSSGLCHLKGSNGYNQTKTYKSYEALDACLADGGKLKK